MHSSGLWRQSGVNNIHAYALPFFVSKLLHSSRAHRLATSFSTFSTTPTNPVLSRHPRLLYFTPDYLPDATTPAHTAPRRRLPFKTSRALPILNSGPLDTGWPAHVKPITHAPLPPPSPFVKTSTYSKYITPSRAPRPRHLPLNLPRPIPISHSDAQISLKRAYAVSKCLPYFSSRIQIPSTPTPAHAKTPNDARHGLASTLLKSPSPPLRTRAHSAARQRQFRRCVENTKTYHSLSTSSPRHAATDAAADLVDRQHHQRRERRERRVGASRADWLGNALQIKFQLTLRSSTSEADTNNNANVRTTREMR
ncbi:hypothetical protein R3P38DRAFT_3165958 [Favolaschia claudopus]|uniref:Uncharacterized protein n=1 Tax=Favolaschia claudopus TaxID=2862362 RepID=A0AAW0EHM7_9AGAR